MSLPKSWFWADTSFVLMAVGAFGPWATAEVGPLSVTANGTEGGKDGWLVVGAAVVAAVALALFLVFRRRLLAVLALLAGCAGAAVAAYDVADIETTEPRALYSAGWGIYLALAGSISLVLASIALILETRRPAP